MAKQREPEQVQTTFTFSSEAELNMLIADYRSQHERKVMITFRVVEKAR